MFMTFIRKMSISKPNMEAPLLIFLFILLFFFNKRATSCPLSLLRWPMTDPPC